MLVASVNAAGKLASTIVRTLRKRVCPRSETAPPKPAEPAEPAAFPLSDPAADDATDELADAETDEPMEALTETAIEEVMAPTIATWAVVEITFAEDTSACVNVELYGSLRVRVSEVRSIRDGQQRS